MALEDRIRWDERYRRSAPAGDVAGAPPLFAPYEDEFPTEGRGLDLACGRGEVAVWLARRGLEIQGVDVSAVAVESARALAARAGVATTCTFAVVDLDEGLPRGASVDVVVCHLFRDPRLDCAIVDRLAPGGLLAVAALSEVGAEPGAFRARPGELRAAFSGLDLIAEGEGAGRAWLLARKRSAPRR